MKEREGEEKTPLMYLADRFNRKAVGSRTMELNLF